MTKAIGRTLSILTKEFLQTFRDPRMKMTIFVAPVIQVLLFGYAATMDLTNVPIAIYDRDNTPQSRDMIRRFYESKYFNIKNVVSSEKELKYLIDRADVLAAIKFDRGFGRDVSGNRTAEVQAIIDGTDSNAASIVISYASQIVAQYNQAAAKERIAVFLKPSASVASVDLRDRRWFNENLESRYFYLPGVIALIVSIMSLLLSAMAIVREKEIGTMEQLMVSPIKPIELILGKVVPFAIIALVQVTIITIVGVLWFKVPIRGSLPLLFISTLVYLLTTLGLGIFISTISATQQEAMMSVFLVFFPITLLSGFVYPIANMPEIVQWGTLINPLRFYLVIIRGIFLKGVGFAVLWDKLLALLIIGAFMITVSSMRFKRTVG